MRLILCSRRGRWAFRTTGAGRGSSRRARRVDRRGARSRELRGFAVRRAPSCLRRADDAGRRVAKGDAAPAAETHGDHGPIEVGLPERPIPLRDGTRPRAHAGDDGVTDAQVYFDQGLALLHDFAWIDAARSFHEVLRRDDRCALAWVGLSRALTGLALDAEADVASARAQACAAAASPREQRFVALRAQQLAAMKAEGEKKKELHAAYKQAIEQAIADFPDEVEFRMVRGNAEEPTPAGIGQTAEKGSIAWYESVLARSPGHFGALHCLCHAWENAGDHQKAFEYADAYRAQTPAIAHSWHMCGHDLPRVGRWADALAMFRKSEQLADDYAKAEHLRPGDDWHRAHNLLLMGYTQLRLRFAGDATAGDPIATFRQQFEIPIRSGGRDYTHSCYAEGLLVVGRGDEALAVARELQSHEQSASSRAAGAAIEGEIVLAGGDLAAAKAKLAQCDAAIAEDDAPKSATGTPGTTAAAPAPAASPAAGAKAASDPPKVSYRGIRANRELLAGLIELHEGDGQAGATHLLAFSDDVAGNPRFDAWGEGLFRIVRAWRAAGELGHAELATQLRARMTKLDPAFDPGAAVTAGTSPSRS
jgi:tetratricopeptide (TPR) repeat protein